MIAANATLLALLDAIGSLVISNLWIFRSSF
jgi:hypothetical protein